MYYKFSSKLNKISKKISEKYQKYHEIHKSSLKQSVRWKIPQQQNKSHKNSCSWSEENHKTHENASTKKCFKCFKCLKKILGISEIMRRILKGN